MFLHTALLFTDIVDSTALASRLGDDAMSAVWAAHDKVAHELLHAHRGRELDRSDGVLLAFADAADAARYAMAYQRELRALPVPLQARAGVHVGPLVERHNDAANFAVGAKPIELDGLVRHVTARVMSVASAGQILLTADARHALGTAPLRTECHGHWRFKGIDEPMELYEVAADRDDITPPADAPKAYRVVRQGDIWVPRRALRHSLPAERDVFIGRHDALRRVAHAYRDGARLVSLTGTGGSGKTRLAQRYGWTWLGDFEGGVWFCDLSQARTLDGLLHATAQGLDIPLGGGDASAQIGNAIAGRGRCLVVLDNFEQVVDHAEATIGRWLERAAEAAFLVTTRERLHVVGEEAIEVQPLAAHDAAALFQRRAEAAHSGYNPGADDRAAIGRLVELLDGLPLAIELAAARVRIMSPRVLLQRMSARFTLLASPTRRTQRQATLRATLDWSWDLLSDAEKSALAQLSVFEGGFDDTAATALLDVSACATRPDPLDLLQSLVDKSLVRRTLEDRFGLLTSIKDYAAEAMRTPGRFPDSGRTAHERVMERHGEHFAHADGMDPLLDLDNLVSACRRAIERGRSAIAARTLDRAWTALRLQGPFNVGRELSRAGLELPGVAVGDRIRLRKICTLAERLLGRAAEAGASAGLGLADADAEGDQAARGVFLASLAEIDVNAGHRELAAERYGEALAIAGRLGEDRLACNALNGRAVLYDDLGRGDDARQDHDAAIRAARRAGDRRDEGGSLGNLGRFLAKQGDRDGARVHYARALTIAHELGDRAREGNTLCNLGLLELDAGRLDDARRHLSSALSIATQLGHVRLEAVVQCNLGLVHDASSAAVQAVACHEAALVIARRLDDRRLEGQFLGYLGAALGRLGVPARAVECFDLADLISAEVSDGLNVGLVRCRRAEFEWRGGDRVAAAVWLARAQDAAAPLDVAPNSEFGLALAALRPLVAAA